VECEGKITEDHWSKTKSSSYNNFISKSGGKVNRKINNRDETRNVQKGKINKLAGIKGK